MRTLTLADTLAIAGSERERLVEADDAIRDAVAAVEEAAVRDGLDARLVGRGLAGVMLAAAARQTLSAYPSVGRRELGDAFVALAEEAFEWAGGRTVKKRRDKKV